MICKGAAAGTKQEGTLFRDVLRISAAKAKVHILRRLEITEVRQYIAALIHTVNNIM
jgi:hypothetical protein